MHNTPKVSIIVPCYNQSNYIAETLDSVLMQTYNNWECIIVNDGSTDQSERIILGYCNKDARFKYISQDNQGVICARNNAIRESKGEYILPLDGDDLISKEYLDLAVRVLDSDNDIVLVYCDVMRFGAVEGLWLLPKVSIRNLLHTGCCVCTSMFRRTSFDLVGGYKYEMNQGWEDWEFYISLLEKGGKAYKINQPLFKYRIIDDSRDRSIAPHIKHELRSRIVRLHPQLYYEQYDAIWKDYNHIINSRKYKLVSIIGKILG